MSLTAFLDEKEIQIYEEFKNSDNYKNYKFRYEELDNVKIDLTFLDMNKSRMQVYDSPTQQAVEYIRYSLLCFPEIKPLIHVMKRYLQIEKLNSSFNGKIKN